MRVESDLLGSLEIDDSNYWGIHTQRALKNFSKSSSCVNFKLVSAYAVVKKAAAAANLELGYLDKDIACAITTACDDILLHKLDGQFPLPYLQGGAGTSLNMNLNEVIANRALEILGEVKGRYEIVNPIDHVNLHQSTNDTYPTALKIATTNGFRDLSNSLEKLQGAFNQKDKDFADILTIGRTEMMPAVPITLGSQFAAMAEAFARDRWRTFKCEERLRVVNIGGTAVGTGLTAPRNYIFLVIEKLRELSGLGIMRAEQLMDATANADVFSEVSGMLNALSANLIKVSSDLRLLHSFGEIKLPALQAGSSIMPGKVNPVICEYVISCGLKAQANDAMLNNCVSRGTLQINEFMPLIAYSILDSLGILTEAVSALAEYTSGITADKAVCERLFQENETIITAFVPHIGYHQCETLISECRQANISNFKEFLTEKLGKTLVDEALSPAALTSLGFRKKK